MKKSEVKIREIERDMSLDIFDGFLIQRRKATKNTTYKDIHHHKFFELELIVSGQVEHNLNGEVTLAGRGWATVVCYRDYHGFERILTDEMEWYHCSFLENNLEEDVFEQMLMAEENLQCVFSEEETVYVIELLNHLYQEHNNRDSNYPTVMHGILNYLVVMILRKKGQDKKDLRGSDLTHKIILMIEQNFTDPCLSLETVASAMKRSTSHVSAAIKEKTNMSFPQYLNRRRLALAEKLLINENITVTQASEMAGFNSVSYFIKQFRDAYGLSPKEYAQTHINK